MSQMEIFDRCHEKNAIIAYQTLAESIDSEISYGGILALQCSTLAGTGIQQGNVNVSGEAVIYPRVCDSDKS